MKTLKYIARMIAKIGHELVILLTGKDAAMVDAGVCDYSGEGRDRYGR